MELAARPAPVSIAEELTRYRAEGFRGVNVTHPYKRDAFHHVATMPHFPKGLTSVNTVLFIQTKTWQTTPTIPDASAPSAISSAMPSPPARC